MMHFLHDAEIAHRTPGRIRLRIPARCGDALFFVAAGRRIAELEGVTGVSTNRYSTSITVSHDEGFRPERLTEAIALASREAQPPSVAISPGRTGQESGGGAVAAMVLQFAVSVLFGRALTHVVELLAKNLVHAALREIAPELQRRLASA